VEFDLLLNVLGLVLIAIGLYVFITGTARPKEGESRSNKFEAFGIKIDVSNPSILLIILGVVLVLVPRFVPDPAGVEQQAAVIEPQAREQSPDVLPAEDEPKQVKLLLANAESVDEPPVVAAAVVAPEPVAVVLPPPESERTVAAIHGPKVRREPKRKQVAETQAVAKVEPATPAVVRPAEAPKPRLAVFVDAEVDEREGVSREDYARRLQQELAQVVREELGLAVADISNRAFRKLSDPKTLCHEAAQEYLLLAELSTPPDALFDRVPSASWPGARWLAVNCEDGRVRKSSEQRLSPHRQDGVIYQTSFAEKSRDFVARQAYFLRHHE
jgi:hypothetical protein